MAELNRPEVGQDVFDGVEIPKLGVRQDEISLARLTGEDMKLFTQAMLCRRDRRWRSAIDCLRRIKYQTEPIVRYFLTRMVYEFEGGVSVEELVNAAITARDLGCADAMLVYAQLEAENRRLPKSEYDASLFDWVFRAIAAGSADAYAVLAGLYGEGRHGFVKRKDVARRLSRMAADAGSFYGLFDTITDFAFARYGNQSISDIANCVRHFLSQTNIDIDELSKLELMLRGIIYGLGIAAVKDTSYAKECFERVISSRGILVEDDKLCVAIVLVYLGNIFQEEGVSGRPEQFERALRCYEQALSVHPCEGLAEYRLGTCYSRDDLGVQKDERRAKEYFRRSAENGCAASMTRLALLYFNDGPDQDVPKARVFLEEAAALEWCEALNHLGWLKCCGTHYDQDLGDGLRLLKKAAAQGDGGAMNSLGCCIETELKGWHPIPMKQVLGLYGRPKQSVNGE